MTQHNATLTLIHDCGPHGDGRYHVSVTTIEGDFELGKYDDIIDAAGRMNRWITHRGLAHVHRTDAPVLVLDAVDRFGLEAELVAERRQAWHNVDVYPYVHVAHRMGC
jgi:hypothetical protein